MMEDCEVKVAFNVESDVSRKTGGDGEKGAERGKSQSNDRGCSIITRFSRRHSPSMLFVTL